MQLRNGKIIGTIKVNMNVEKVIEKIEEKVSEKMEQKIEERIAKTVEERVKKMFTCDCGKQCYLVLTGRCCKCSDKRSDEEKENIVYRGDGIYYHGDSWGYCPLCNDSRKSNKYANRNFTCQGCMDDQPNQLAHMEPGGCLYTPSYYA